MLSNSKNTILPVVVLYNMDYYSSNVYNTLLLYYPTLHVLVYDNSPNPQLILDENIIYYHDKSNGGVTAGYNYAAAYVKNENFANALLLLDQDTCFESDYIVKLNEAMMNYPKVSLFVPRLFYKNDIVFSPYKRSILSRNNPILHEGLYSLYNYLPVNSGTCIRLRAFENICGYNKSIKLDFADIDFFSRLCIVDDQYYVLKSVAQQQFSNEESNLEKLSWRFLIYLQDGKAAKANILIKNFVCFMILKHTLALTYRTKSFFFIKSLFKAV